MTVISAFQCHRNTQKEGKTTMSNVSESLTELKTDILHASISVENEKKEKNQKEDSARMLRARRAIEQHLEQKRLSQYISDGWDE